MKRSRRPHASPRIRIALAICFCLIAATVTPFSGVGAKQANAAAIGFGESTWSKVSSEMLGSLLTFFQGGGGYPNVPGENLPDLDAARSQQPAAPEALPAIPSEAPNPDICNDCDPINHRPVAVPGGPYFGSPGQPIQFDGSHSTDPDGDDIIDYVWTFGDTSPAVEVHGISPTHTYTAAGNYTVTLKVKDEHNSFSFTVNTSAGVGGAPTPTPTPGASPTPTPNPSNAATFVSQSVPSSMTSGEHYNVSVTMHNSGGSTWSAAHLYRLGSQNPTDNQDWGMSRIYLPADVQSGADVTFSFLVTAPFGSELGITSKHFQWRMIQDGVGGFGDTSDQVVAVTTVAQTSDPNTNPNNVSSARLEPGNRTGQAGEDLVSGNFNWSNNLLGLAGRAGLDLNVLLSYNSLAVWTKVTGNRESMTFDADRGFPSAGFRLGFPSIQGPFFNNQTNKNAYLLITTSGGHTELRHVDNSDVYEAADSSYLQLVDGGNGSLTLRSADGTQFAYQLINDEFRCTQIKDRNGNFIDIKYELINGTPNTGRITSIVDTLNRTVNFTYDANYRLQTIEQPRAGQSPHVWATFGYNRMELQPDFVGGYELSSEATADAHLGGLPVFGLPENKTVTVLTQVGLDDGSFYKFDYSTWGQVYQITHYAADSDSHALSYVFYDLPQDSRERQVDCPRFSQRRDWAENWHDDEPATTNFAFDSEGQWGERSMPDGTTAYREYFTKAYTSWGRGLVTKTEIYDRGTVTKTTLIDWTQDATSVSYPLNPRATTVTVSDAEGNRRRTTTDYTSFGLASDVYEWGPTGSTDWTLLRRTHTNYELSATYLNRRILGLPKQEFLFGPEDNWQRLYSKASFEYDEGGEFLADQGNAVQHDGTNFGSGLVQGRANTTRALRWDVNYETDINHATVSRVGYNTNGSIIFSRDGFNHQTDISYNDSFSSNGVDSTTLSVVTLAYPTMITVHDPNPISSSAKYDYDLGAVTRQQDPKGAAQTTTYDAAGRVKQITNTVNSAYTRFVYPPSQTIVNKFTTISDLQHEAYTATILDGAGRIRATAGDFPNSTGHYSGQFTLYDVMGRAIQQTNPTEMTNLWSAAGDDAGGWIPTTQTYDWKGRPLITTNQDGTTKEASYGGCGCAGGAVVTLIDEGTLASGIAKKRQQKIYSDALGRAVKTEVLNWDGSGPFGTGSDSTVYSTTVNSYDALDQVTRVRQYQGTEGSGVYQDTVKTYDGYGRLKTKHLPQQQVDNNLSGSTDHTTWIYNADDTVQSVIDARGVSANYAYNARQLVTGISYSAPAGITASASATFEYDSAGKRTSMTDGLGSQTYNYDQLSRMTSESRTFSGFGTYSINYAYNMANELTSITDPFGAQVGYGYDALGRVSSVTGSGFPNVSTYANNFQYRAGGQLKHLTLGDYNQPLNTAYNARLLPTSFSAPGISMTYQYYDDGRVKFSADTFDHRFDRSYGYDHAGRLAQAYSGAEARGEPATDNRPYKQNYGFDVWNNLTARTGRHWSHNNIFVGTYTNNRMDGWQYDADGRNTVSNSVNSTYDAAGRAIQTSGPQRRNNPPLVMTQGFDGDGQRIRKVEYNEIYWLLRSTVLGQVITEMYGTQNQFYGQRLRGFVYVNGTKLAEQTPAGAIFVPVDPSGVENMAVAGAQLDPLGNEVGDEDPYLPGGGGDPGINYPRFGDMSDGSYGCTVDGEPWPCTFAFKYAGVRPSTISTNGPYAWVGISYRQVQANQPPGNNFAPPTSGRQPQPTVSNTSGYIGSTPFSHVESVWMPGHEENIWQCCDNDGNWYPVPTAFTGYQFFVSVMEPQKSETGADLAQRAATGLSKHPGLLEEIVKNVAAGVDAHIVACQGAKESNYSKLSQVPPPFKNAGEYESGATGAKGEIGFLQIFPATAHLSADALRNVGTNVKASSSYLMGLKNHFNVDMRTALAIYNWGPAKFNRVDRDPEKIYSGSLSYADKILDCASQLYLPSDKNPYKFLP